MKIKLLIIIVAAALAVGGVTAGVTIYNNQPQNVAISAVMGVFDDLAQREEIAPIVNMAEKGSLKFSMSELSVDDEDMLESFDVEGKLYFDSNKAFMLDDFKFKYNDKKITGSAYVSSDTIYINETSLIDANIGVVKGDLAEDFEDSIFAYGSGSQYEIEDKETYDLIVDVLKSVDSLDSEKMSKDLEKIAKKYIKELWAIFCEYAEFEDKTDTIKLNGDKASVRVITIMVDEKDVANIIDDAYDFISKDKDVVKFIEKYEEDFMVIAEDYFDTSDYDSLADAYKEFIDEIGENIDDYCDQVKQQEIDLEIEIVTPKLSSDMLRFTVSVDDEELVSVDFGKDGLKKTDMITVESAGTKFVYEITKNDSRELNAVLEFDGEEVISFELDKKKNDFTLDIPDTLRVEGEMSTKGDQTTIKLEKIIAYSYDYDEDSYESIRSEKKIETDLKIVIDEKDKMPSIEKDFDRVSDITEEDIKKWMEAFEGMFN